MGGICSISFSCDQLVNQVSQWLCLKESYIHNLEENLEALEKTMEELKARRDDLLRKVQREEDNGLRRLSKIQVWFTRVETIETKVNGLLGERTFELQRLCLCGFCSKNLELSYQYGKRVFKISKEVDHLQSNGVFEVVAEQAQASELVERPVQSLIVGQEIILEMAWKKLMEDGVGTLGLYGMGGVGKTTLLTQINNYFVKKGNLFDSVIWVVVSKDLQIVKIQDAVAKSLGMAGHGWDRKDEDQKACHIHNVLKGKKFVLLLDDIWEKVNLSQIGVPSPSRENGCKVVFTTRSTKVCGRMGVDVEMEVQCLTPSDALCLFLKKVGEIALGSHPDIPELANIVAKKCHGLPLALNVIGETMSCKRTIQEWQHAVDVLSSYASEFCGMEDEILPILKYSYDNLKDEQLKSCLLYCSLFPEDHRIDKDDLINYWIYEEIIDASEGMKRAENKGYEIIGNLICTSLLMEGEKKGSYQVYMHDVVREMALWIASDLGKQKDIFIVRAGTWICEMPKVDNWKNARKMSLMSNKIVGLSHNPECLQLTTLFLQDNEKLTNISAGFFRSMPRLVVLDLSKCVKLSKLPGGISKLVSLKYLNMSYTCICHLPAGLLELKKLIHLDLQYTPRLSSIVGISRLKNLKVLKMLRCGASGKLSTVKELLVFEHLELLSIRVASGIDLFLQSKRLMSCTQILEINSQTKSSELYLPTTMDNLKLLDLIGCNISEIKIDRTVSTLQNPTNPCFLSLSRVFLEGCKYLRDLTFLMFASNIISLHVDDSIQLVDIISKEKACVIEESGIGIVPFRKLEELYLNDLPELQNIYWRPLPFLCLKSINVIKCPKLRKLPLDSNSGPGGEKGLRIECREKEWIERVEWEDQATKARFLPSWAEFSFRESFC